MAQDESLEPIAILALYAFAAAENTSREQLYFSLDDPRDCAVVSAHFADGSAWQNPSIGATPGPLPTAVPDAIDARERARWAPRHGFPTPLATASGAAVASPNRDPR
jgi:hypothetical protein